MLNRARAGASEVPSHGSGEQLRGPFLAFGGRHRDLAGARLGGGWTDQRECSGLRLGAQGSLPGISPAMSRFHDSCDAHLGRTAQYSVVMAITLPALSLRIAAGLARFTQHHASRQYL